MRDNELFAKLLFSHGHGYPFWRPEPNLELSEEYSSVGPRIGDVGIITRDGGFDFLFNVCYKADHAINIRGVPPNFIHIDPGTLELDKSHLFHQQKTHISTKNITKTDIQLQLSVGDSLSPGFEFHISSSVSEGAILMLPTGAFREDLLNRKPFYEMSCQNAAVWYQYATETRGRMISDDSLYLVTGCDKCTSWGVAAFSDNSGAVGSVLKLIAAGIGGAQGALTYNWEKPTSVAARSGPSYFPRLANQCVFRRGYRIAVRPQVFSPPKINIAAMEEADNSELFRSSLARRITDIHSSVARRLHARTERSETVLSDSRGPSSSLSLDINETFIQDTAGAQPLHPLDAVNWYLLEKTHCAVIVTHDDLWTSVLGENDAALPNYDELIQRIQERYQMVVHEDSDVASFVCDKDGEHYPEYSHSSMDPQFNKSDNSYSEQPHLHRPTFVSVEFQTDEGIEDTQLQTQSTQDSSHVLPLNDAHIWAYLMPVSPTLGRIDLWRSNPRYNVGRNQKNNQIVFPGLKISNNHCTIVWDGEEQNPTVVIQDKSTNGTFINGVKIGKDKSRALRDGNEIAFGTAIPQIERPNEDYRFIYRYVAGGRPSTGMFAVYDITAELGRGSFATVYKVVHHVTGKYYAAKMIHEPRRTGRTDQSVRTKFGREISIMESLDHPNICQLKEVFHETEGDLGLILEYVEGGDLLEYTIKSEVGLSEAMGQHITYQICDALSYLHQLGVAHRDLKPENVLLTKDNPPIVKVADFGLAKVADNATILRTMCGTPSYLAPEVVDSLPNVGYDHLVDSWSVGTIVFSMLTNMTPFKVDQSVDIVNQIRTRTIDWEHIGHLSLQIQTFIRSLLEIAPTRRMTLTDALTHPWLAEYAVAPRYRFDGRIPISQPVVGGAGPRVNYGAPMDGVVSADVAMASLDGPTSQASEKLGIKAEGAPGAPGPSQDLLFPGSQNNSVAREASRMLQRRSNVVARAHEGQGDIPEPSAEMRERIIKAAEGSGSNNAEGSNRKRRHSELSLEQGSSNGASKKAR